MMLLFYFALVAALPTIALAHDVAAHGNLRDLVSPSHVPEQPSRPDSASSPLPVPQGTSWILDGEGKEKVVHDIQKQAAKKVPETRGFRNDNSLVGIGDLHLILEVDFHLLNSYFDWFVVVKVGTHGIVLVPKYVYDTYNAATDEYVFVNPNGCLYQRDVVTGDMLDLMLDEFDTKIYVNVTQIFGEPRPRGSEGKKTWILVTNIRDPEYHGICNPGMNKATGYFLGDLDDFHDKNMIHMDSSSWQDSIGPEGEWKIETAFAHELQHQVHYARHAGDEAWVAEGFASLAPYICGYGHPSLRIAQYLRMHPVTSLIEFPLFKHEHYGASYLFVLYLYEKFGGNNFFKAYYEQPAFGIEGIGNALHALGYDEGFNTVFDRWTIANYIDYADGTESSVYGYKTLEIGGNDTLGYTVPNALETEWSLNISTAPFEIEASLLPYTVHYHRFYDSTNAAFYLNGTFSNFGMIQLDPTPYLSNNTNETTIGGGLREKVAIISNKNTDTNGSYVFGAVTI